LQIQNLQLSIMPCAEQELAADKCIVPGSPYPGRPLPWRPRVIWLLAILAVTAVTGLAFVFFYGRYLNALRGPWITDKRG
jgi:hypothetical protein